MDMEKVKYDIERCICHVPDACRDCSHYKHGEYLDCMEELLKDALALLNQQENDIHHMGLIIDEYEKELKKKQEAVEPHYNARTNWYECGACHYSMTSGMHCRSELIPAYKVGFCAKCGKAVIWK